MLTAALILTAVLGAFSGDQGPSSQKAQAALATTSTRVVTFEGACDASGAVVLGPWSFLGRTGGRPVRTTDLSSALELSPAKKRAPEVDIEAATGIPPLSFWYEDKDEVLILSDDGSRLIEGTECKRLKEPAKKQFRGVWVRLPGQP